MKAKLQTLASWVPDALIVAGVCGLSYGARLAYEPAGYIVGGALVLAAGVLSAKAK